MPTGCGGGGGENAIGTKENDTRCEWGCRKQVWGTLQRSQEEPVREMNHDSVVWKC